MSAFEAWIKQGSGSSAGGDIPSYSIASLPPPDGHAQLAQLTDGSRTLIRSNGAQWLKATVYDPRDFGAVGDGVTNDVTAFNAMLATSDPAISIFLPPLSFYLASSWHIAKPIELFGCGGGVQQQPGSKFVLAPGASIVLDSSTSGPFLGLQGAQGSVLRNFGVFASRRPPVWQSLHGYVLGDIVLNTNYSGGFTQLVYVCTTAGTSGGTEPAFPRRNDFGYITEGTTVSDGSVVWTCQSWPGIWMKNQAVIEDIYFQGIAGDGIYGYGYLNQDPATFCSGFRVTGLRAQECLGRGFYIEGSDASGGYSVNHEIQNCYSGGIFDNTALGNVYQSCLTEANGVNYWTANTPFSVYSVISSIPTTVPSPAVMDMQQTAHSNPFFYHGSGSGNTGGSEPTWPTVIGGSVVDNGITWTCAGVYHDGQANMATLGALNSSVFIGGYREPDQRLDELDVGTLYIGMGGGMNSLRANSKTCAIDGPRMSPIKVIANDSNATYNTALEIGNAHNQLGAFDVALEDKNGTSVDSIGLHMAPFSTPGTNDYLGFTSDASTASLLIPMGLNTDGGFNAPIVTPNGIRFKGFSGSGSVKANSTIQRVQTINDVGGDTALLNIGNSANRSGAASRQVVAISGDGASTKGIWNEAAWRAPISGHRIDTFSEFGETDLHFLIDDLMDAPYSGYGPLTPYSTESFKSRVGNFVIAGTGNWSAYTPASAQFSSDIFYDSALRGRKIIDLRGSANANYGTIAANSANTLPTSGTRTLEMSFFCFGLSSKFTLLGCADTLGHNGYDLSINTDGSIEFTALNTSGGNYIDLKSSASAVTTGKMHYAAVTFDSSHDLYALWLDGDQVATSITHTGTLGNSQLDLGFCGLLTDGVLTNGFTSSAFSLPSELIRHTRALTPSEIVNRSQQFRAANGLPSIILPGVESLLSSTVVDTALSTKQNLYTVPAGKTAVITKVIARSSSATITTASGTIGYNAAADDVAIATMNLPNISGTFTVSVPDGNGVNQAKLGVAAAVLGFKTTATDTPTLTLDVFGYLF